MFKLSLDEENFNLFGNDMIQCFYDVATVSGEDVRNRALKYVEQLAHRWKHSIVMVLRGWKVGEVPTPDEVMQALIGVRSYLISFVRSFVSSFSCMSELWIAFFLRSSTSLSSCPHLEKKKEKKKKTSIGSSIKFHH